MHTSEQYVLPFHKGKSVCWNRYPPTLTSNFLFGLFSMVRAFQALANPKIKWLLNFQAIFWLFPKLSHSHSFWFRLIFQQHVLLAFFFGFTKKRIKSNKQQESQRIRVCWKSQKLQWFPRFSYGFAERNISPRRGRYNCLVLRVVGWTHHEILKKWPQKNKLIVTKVGVSSRSLQMEV